MSSSVSVLLMLLGAVGVLDAAIGAVWDLAVLFAVVILVGAVGLLMGISRRRSVTLRADLAAALSARTRPAGESFDQVLDRAVATYLHALEEPSPPTA